MTIFGMEMQQNLNAPGFISGLLDDLNPKTILELGTGPGGLTVMLGVWAYNSEAVMVSWDTNPGRRTSKINELLALLKVELRNADYSAEAEQEYIRSCINTWGAKPVLVLCDGGNKPKEMEMFAPMLRVGDAIMAHDYAPDARAVQTRYVPRIWSCCEIDDHTVRKLRPLGFEVYAPELAAAAWICLRKNS